MTHTLKLSEECEAILRQLASRLGQSEQLVLEALTDAVLLGEIAQGQASITELAKSLTELQSLQGNEVAQIKSTPDIMGGDACIRNTRIPVWLLVEYKKQGLTDGQLLQAYPGLNASDLIAAWDYFASHADEVDRQHREHEEAI